MLQRDGCACYANYFINGNQIPDAYSIEDLQYFLADQFPAGRWPDGTLPRTADRGSQANKAKRVGTNNFINLKKQIKMQTKKMSLANIQGKLSRTEMKNIMAGSGSDSCGLHHCNAPGGCPSGCYCPIATTHCGKKS